MILTTDVKLLLDGGYKYLLEISQSAIFLKSSSVSLVTAKTPASSVDSLKISKTTPSLNLLLVFSVQLYIFDMFDNSLLPDFFE